MVARFVAATSAVAASIVGAKIAARSVDPKSLVRWGSRHGTARAVIGLAARTGDPYARLCGDADLRADPYDFYDEIRAAQVLPGKFALVTARHDLISEIVRMPEAFLAGFPDETLPGPVRKAVAWAQEPSAMSALDRPSMLVSNGPEHARYRRLAMRAFTARAVSALTARIEEMSVDLLDEMARRERDGDRGDVIAEFASILPVLVIAEILGVPPEMRERFRAWADPIVPLTDFGISYPTFRRAEAALRELNGWFVGHFERLRRNPGEDLLSRIVSAAQEEAEEGVDDVGLMVTSTLLLIAGFETTVNLLGNGSVLLMNHPDQLAKLLVDPAGWPNAVEEILRFDSPVQNTGRYPPQDTVIRGVPIRRGQFIVLLTGAANRDPAVFDDPNTFDVMRANAREHLSFSLGPHFCVGAALARLEGEIGLRLLFERFPEMSLAGPLSRRATRAVRGFSAVPVRLNASTRPER